MARVLLIGALSGDLASIAAIATSAGAQVSQADHCAQGLETLRRVASIAAIFVDIDLDAENLMLALRTERFAVPVFVAGHDISPDQAAQAMRLGARDVVPLPANVAMVVALLASVGHERPALPGACGKSSEHAPAAPQAADPVMLSVLRRAEQIAFSDASVLITGESGTGKEVIARLIHARSRRAQGPFVAINCAAIPEALLESELFGHEKGAFSGAVARRLGKFEAASGGTLLLDEISEMHVRLQSKLLRAIQEREIDRVGGNAPVRINVRILATSNRDLPAEAASGRFREDLYFRLNVVGLRVPALRERPADIPALAIYFVRHYADLNGVPRRVLSDAALARLRRNPWRGNVRELENTLHRAVLLATGDDIGAADIELTNDAPAAAAYAGATDFVGRPMAEVERDHILHTLNHTAGNRTHAAVMLGISIRALRNKLKDYTRPALACRRRKPAWPHEPSHRTGLALNFLGLLRRYAPGTDVGLALGIFCLLSLLILPLPTMLLDLGLSLSVTISVLVLMVALFLERPLDFTSFPQLLLLTTLLRLSLNVATTRLILSHGNEGPTAAGQVVAAFGGFLMGGDVVIGLILFAILLVVNFMVITKGSGRIAEVAARFSLDAMPGKQMAIDADLNAGLVNEKTARARRRELEEESGFYGAMDGAAKFVRGDAVAGLIITSINIVGGLAIGLLRHGMSFGDAANTFTTLTVGDGLVTQVPALLVSTAAGIVVTKGGVEGRADTALAAQLGRSHKPLALAGAAAAVMATMPGLPALPFLALAILAGSGAWWRFNHPAVTGEPETIVSAPANTEAPLADAMRIDMIRVELGYGLLPLAGGDQPKLTEQIRALRRSIATEMGFVLPPVRIQDNLQLGAEQYVIRIKEIEAGRGELRAMMLLAMDPAGGTPTLAGERTVEPAFGLPAVWIDPNQREAALIRNCTVVDPPSVLATHLTELVRDMMPELLSYAEAQKLLDELPREHQKLVSDLVPNVISVGGIQRVLQALLAERVSIRDLPTILEGIHEACAGQPRAIAGIVAIVRVRLARQLCESHTSTAGVVPLITLSAEWETAFAESLVGPAEDRQLAMAPSRLGEFMRRFREVFDEAATSTPVLLTSPAIRAPVRAIVERIRPATPVLAQSEIHPRARIRTIGTI